MKAKGVINDYGIEIVEKLGDIPKVVVNFQLIEKDDDVKYETMKWDGLFLTRDGKPNDKTIKSLVAMGFTGDDPIVLAEGTGLSMDREYFLTISINDKGYQYIEWVNDKEHTGGVQGIKKASKDALKEKFAAMKLSGAFKKVISEMPAKEPELFNHAEKVPF